MGAPPDNDRDPNAVEGPVDDAWSAGSPVHNDRTTHGLLVEPVATSGNHDRTTIGTGKDRVLASDGDRTTIDPPLVPPAVTEDSTVASIDQTMAELERSHPGGDNEHTKAGLGVALPEPSVALPEPSAPAPVLRAGGGKIPLEKERELEQPERSPLAFVMRDMEPSAAPRTPAASGDSSVFVTSLLGDQPPPPRITTDAPPVAAMEPVLRRARRRRRRIVVGGLAATAAVSMALAIKLTDSKETPSSAAYQAAKVNEGAPAAPETAAPAPAAIDNAPPAETPPPTAPEPTTDVAVTPSATHAPATKSETTAKRTTKKSSKAVKKVSSSKKSTTAKKTTRKKSSQRSGRRTRRTG